MSELDIRAIAFFLPQFHPIPENDHWWGKGFTEWTNVAKCTPYFPGHYQPHLPADLGFYDLRLPEVREEQANLARQYGIHGFCYYHYWFNGRRVLERPVNDLLQSKRPNFPFCICWANENWTRRWDGLDDEVLLQQNYSLEDDRNHIKAILETLHDPRYIKVDGKPLLLIYRISSLPNPADTIGIWRDEAVRSGLEGLFLCNVESNKREFGLASKLPLDAAVEFAPDWTKLAPMGRGRFARNLQRLRSLVGNKSLYIKHSISDYETVVQRMMNKPNVEYSRIPCVTPMWDNSARRKNNATILHASHPKKYEAWLRNRAQFVRDNPSCKGLVFINAWNEWAEGNHLEPCQRWGHAYLEATKRALSVSN